MSDSVTTPLLHPEHVDDESELPAPVAHGQNQDHPAFLRACHSPWRWMPQNALCYIRGAIVVYLVAIGIMILDYKIEQEESQHSDWRILFQFELVTFVFLLAYHIVVFAWTFTHLYFPRIDDVDSGWEYALLRGMSLPSNMGSLRKQFYFTLFYFTTTIATIGNSMMYWLFTLPKNDSDDDQGSPPPPAPSALGWADSPLLRNNIELQQEVWFVSEASSGRAPFTDIFGKGWFKAFVYLNMFAITTGIALIELFFLNSIKRPIAIGAHIFSLLFLSGLFLGWASIGKALTGADSFYWLNEDEVGSREAVVANCIGFVMLSPIIFSLVYGFIAIRETISKSVFLARMTASAENRSE